MHIVERAASAPGALLPRLLLGTSTEEGAVHTSWPGLRNVNSLPP